MLTRFSSTFVFGLTLFLSTILGAYATPIMDTFTGFAGFGDSLSDKGRNNGFAAPSLDSRYSNGQTWMEIIGAEFDLRGQANINLALGGATAGLVNFNDPFYQFLDSVTPRNPADPDDIPLFNLGTFDRQITSLVNAGFDASVGDNPLVALQFGGNDFLQNLTSPTFNPISVANDVVEGVRRLTELDDKFDDFLILNLANLADTPFGSTLSAFERLQITGATQLFNAALDGGFAALEAELELVPGVDVNFNVFDAFTVNQELFASAGALGLRTDISCTDRIVLPAQDRAFNLCPTVESANDFYFVDGVHPNAVVHSQFAQRVLPLIQQQLTPVPLPSSLSLILLGFAVLVGSRLRRSA